MYYKNLLVDMQTMLKNAMKFQKITMKVLY